MAVISLMGAIGTGKTIQAEAVAKKLGWRTFSTGQLLRDMHDPEVSAYQNAGKPVPTEVTQKVVLDYIKALPSDASIIFDGSPRLQPEADRYDQELPAMGRKFDLIIVLEVHDDERNRRIHSRGRADDTPEGIAGRMAWFHNDIMPIIKGFEQRGIVRYVDGDADMDVVTDRIVAAIKEAGLV